MIIGEILFLYAKMIFLDIVFYSGLLGAATCWAVFLQKLGI